MVTKRQINKLKKKLNIDNNEQLPSIFMKGKDEKIRDINTGKEISNKELQEANNNSIYPNVILVRGGQNSNKKTD